MGNNEQTQHPTEEERCSVWTPHSIPTRSLACWVFVVSSSLMWQLATCSVALTDRMTGCSDSLLNMPNAPTAFCFSYPTSLTTCKLAQGLESWLVRVILIVLPVATKTRSGFMPLWSLNLTWWPSRQQTASRRSCRWITTWKRTNI